MSSTPGGLVVLLATSLSLMTVPAQTSGQERQPEPHDLAGPPLPKTEEEKTILSVLDKTSANAAA